MIKNIVILILGLTIGGAVYFAAQGGELDLSKINFSPGNLASSKPETIIESKTVYREQSDVVNVVRRANPAVVSIAIKRPLRPFSNRNPFGSDIFGFSPQVEPDTSGEAREDGIGTGFIITKEGVVVTNRHVVDNQAEYVVITNDNQKFDVSSITKDPFNDIAILRVSGASNLTPVELGDSDAMEVGQSVVAMGNALGEFSNSVTVGIVSGLSRNITAGDRRGNSETLQGLIQTDAAINPGNSGGPLLNLGAQVIGVNTAVAEGSYAQNIGFAIPINKVKPMIEEYLRTGKIARPYLGVQYRMLTRQLAVYYDVPEGAYLFESVPNSPAAQAGLQEGDIITEIDGKKINSSSELSQVVRTLSIGKSVEVKFYREGQSNSVRIQVGEFQE